MNPNYKVTNEDTENFIRALEMRANQTGGGISLSKSPLSERTADTTYRSSYSINSKYKRAIVATYTNLQREYPEPHLVEMALSKNTDPFSPNSST
jgi:hypothetical protein